MKILILGAAGFIGTNITLDLMKNPKDELVLFDREETDFSNIEQHNTFDNITIAKGEFASEYDFDKLTSGCDIIYHLISSTVPTTSNQHIPQELMANVIVTANLLEACVKNQVGKVVFLSSGGTVYGREKAMPLKEDTATYPITSYGIQKITIEKLLYLYHYMYGLDYRVIRLANPYGPYQKPNGIQGAVTTFTYKALKNETLTIYGDGEVIRDYIYIDDAIQSIHKIVNTDTKEKTFNLGSGVGHSLNEVVKIIDTLLDTEVKIEHLPGRNVDVPKNILDMSLYEEKFGKLQLISLEEGVQKLIVFMREYYRI